MDDLFALANLDLPHLKFKPWTPLVPPRLAGEDVDFFEVIRAGDVLVHHPYESFAGERRAIHRAGRASIRRCWRSR